MRHIQHLALIIAIVAISGCCIPLPCGPMPGSSGPCQPRGCAAMPGCPQYSEIQHPYLDPSGRTRIMGDTRFRNHLGLPLPGSASLE